MTSIDIPDLQHSRSMLRAYKSTLLMLAADRPDLYQQCRRMANDVDDLIESLTGLIQGERKPVDD